MRLIDADALLEGAKDYSPIQVEMCGYYDFAWLVNAEPTIEAAPVVHGRWKYGTRAAVCSECGFERHLDDNYGRAIACPNCGAKMNERS